MIERVLVVDDDPVERRSVESIVRKAGYETASVDGGEAALEAMRANAPTRYDCVVLDLVMPDLAGLDVLGKMREAGLEIPVIVQIADGSTDDVDAAMRAGAFDFVVKPVGFERLSVSLRNAMAIRTLAAEIAHRKRSRRGTLTLGDIAVGRQESPQIAATIGDSNAGALTIAASVHATLAPTDNTGAELLYESNIGRVATKARLFLNDSVGHELPMIPAQSMEDGCVLNLLNESGHVHALQVIEAAVIRFALAHYHGQMSEVARRLRIGRSTLYRKLEVLGCATADNTGS